MSSMRNSIQRRSHRERAQPLERKRLGLLEKHKDYKLRAKDWSKKKETLQKLREKAAERNEDEFSYKMLSRNGPGSALTRGNDNKRAKNWDGTSTLKQKGEQLTEETIRLLKSQDMGYVRTVRNVVTKEVQMLEQRAAIARSFTGHGGIADAEDEEDDDGFGGFDDDDDDKAAPKKMSKAKKRAPKTTGTRIVFAETPKDREEEIEKSKEIQAQTVRRSDEQRSINEAERLQRRLTEARKRLRVLNQTERELDRQRAGFPKSLSSMTGRNRKALTQRRKR